MKPEHEHLALMADRGEMTAFKFAVCCKLGDDYHEDYTVWAVSEEHARKIGLVVFFNCKDMASDDATFLCVTPMEDLARIYPGLDVVAEQQPEEIEA